MIDEDLNRTCTRTRRGLANYFEYEYAYEYEKKKPAMLMALNLNRDVLMRHWIEI